METAEKIVLECMNMTLIESKSKVKLVQMVHSAHTQVCSIYSKLYMLYIQSLHKFLFGRSAWRIMQAVIVRNFLGSLHKLY